MRNISKNRLRDDFCPFTIDIHAIMKSDFPSCGQLGRNQRRLKKGGREF